MTGCRRVALLYSQTAQLLSHVVKALESTAGSDLAREALRILCERLVAVCCMREAAQAPTKYQDMTKQFTGLLAKHSQAGHTGECGGSARTYVMCGYLGF